MENPFTPKQDQCASGCAPDALINIEKCYEADPRLLAVSVPGVSSVIVFFKDTVRVIAKIEPCKDIYATTGVKAPAVYDHVVITGKMLYAEQIGLHFPPKPKMHTIELNPQATVVGTTKYPTATELAEALQAIVADCDCSCEGSPNPPPPPPPIEWFNLFKITSDRFFDTFLEIQSSGFKNFRLLWKPPPGETAGQTPCIEALLLPFGDGLQYLTGGEGTTTFTVEDCRGILPSKTFTAIAYTLEIGDYGAFSETYSAQAPTCLSGDLEISVFATDVLTGVNVNLITGEVTVPFQTIVGVGKVGLMYKCDGDIVQTVMYSVVNPPNGLRMIFDQLGNMPAAITNPGDISQWNALFNLPGFGNSFDGVYVGGNMVMLHDSNINNIQEMNDNLFSGSGLIEFADLGFIVQKIGDNSFTNSAIQSVYVPNCHTIGFSAFSICSSLKNIEAQNATSVSSYAFQNCVGLTNVNLQSVTFLGLAPDDATVFAGVTGATIKVRVPIAMQTADAGNMHASLAYLDANNTVTFNWS